MAARPQLLHRIRSPAAWEQEIRDFWIERRDYMPKNPEKGFKKNAEFVKLITNIEDLREAFRILRTIKQPIPQIFLDTRPPYMSREGPQWEPCHTGYLALLEGILEDVPGFTMASQAELDQFLQENRELVQFNTPQLQTALMGRLDYERKRALGRKQRFFMDYLRDDVIAWAMHPNRVEHILNKYGFEGLESWFGNE